MYYVYRMFGIPSRMFGYDRKSKFSSLTNPNTLYLIKAFLTLNNSWGITYAITEMTRVRNI